MFGAGVGVKEISGKSLGFFVAFAKFTKLTEQKHDWNWNQNPQTSKLAVLYLALYEAKSDQDV